MSQNKPANDIQGIIFKSFVIFNTTPSANDIQGNNLCDFHPHSIIWLNDGDNHDIITIIIIIANNVPSIKTCVQSKEIFAVFIISIMVTIVPVQCTWAHMSSSVWETLPDGYFCWIHAAKCNGFLPGTSAQCNGQKISTVNKLWMQSQAL